VNQRRPGPGPDSPTELRPKPRWAPLGHWVPPVAAAASAALVLWQAGMSAPSGAFAAVTAPIAAKPAAIALALTHAAPVAVSAPLAARLASLNPSVAIVVGRNDTLDSIFRRLSLNMNDLASIRGLPGIRQSLDLLKPGEAIQVTRNGSALKELRREVSETQTLQVVRDNAGFAATVIDRPFEVHRLTATAVIDSSLFEAAERAHLSDSIAMELTNIFQWDVDFVLDIREGDRFTVVYEQLYQNGTFKRDGAVLAAEFVNDGKVYRAVRHVSDRGTSSFYSPDGRPMRKAFLRTPVQFTRVSSRFNPHRHHPILNIIRGHMGTDYAAPFGTPVHAASDGRVVYKGRKGGYGNVVILAHSNGISTIYGHLSRFRKGLRLGGRIEQGQVIAYVGMTGLATGPHLHYEYIVDGVHKNPETVRLPGALPLLPQELAQFGAEAAPLVAALDAADQPAVAAAANSVSTSARVD
jgi:murein DD-endopeptidase MepM/ murein hydrolase activator NlpD